METRRFDQKTLEKREIEGSDGKLLVNCGKKGKKKEGRRDKGEKRKNWRKHLEKGKNWRREGGKGREREKGRLGSPEGRKPATRYRKRHWNFACHVPSTFARKATMFEPPLKKNKKCGKIRKNAHHDRTIQSHQHGKPSAVQFSGTKHKGTNWDRQRSCKIGPTTAKKPPKMPQN